MNILGTIRTWNRVRKTRNELSGLSSWALNDLGISRGEISTISKRPYRV
jgi:uncharacterized protein YjiS (DUF1127 family)